MDLLNNLVPNSIIECPIIHHYCRDARQFILEDLETLDRSFSTSIKILTIIYSSQIIIIIADSTANENRQIHCNLNHRQMMNLRSTKYILIINQNDEISL